MNCACVDHLSMLKLLKKWLLHVYTYLCTHTVFPRAGARRGFQKEEGF